MLSLFFCSLEPQTAGRGSLALCRAFHRSFALPPRAALPACLPALSYVVRCCVEGKELVSSSHVPVSHALRSFVVDARFLAAAVAVIYPRLAVFFFLAHNPSRVPPLRKKLGHFFPAGVVFIRSEWRRWRVGKRKGRPLLSILAGGSALSSDSVRCVAARSFAPRLAHSRCAYAPHRRTAQAAATSPPGLCRRGEIGPVVLCCSQPPVVSSDSHGCAPRCLSACALLPARALRLVVRSSRCSGSRDSPAPPISPLSRRPTSAILRAL